MPMTPKERRAVAELEASYRRVSLKPSEAIPSLLYHYTSAAGLVGIVKSGILWASNFFNLTDSTEIHYGRQLVQEIIRERLATEPSGKSRTMLALVDKALEDTKKGIEFYIACFCTKRDLLSQWRAYGSAKGRFSIGFDTVEWSAGLRYSRVVYKRYEQRRKIERSIDAAIKGLSA